MDHVAIHKKIRKSVELRSRLERNEIVHILVTVLIPGVAIRAYEGGVHVDSLAENICQDL
jgi:hypothetical protein